MSLLHRRRSRWEWTWLVVTAGLLALGPVLAARPSLWGGFVAAMLGASAGLVVLWRRDALSVREILVGAVLLRLAFLPLMPGLSDDMFRYVWDGWLQWEGVNPYRFVPSDPALADLHDRPLYEELNSRDYYSVYPPISQLVFAAGGAVGDESWRLSYTVIKGLFVALELAGVWLLKRLTTARNALLYAWNPLVLVEVAGQGHTEAAAVPFLLGAVWAVRNDRGRLASLAVAGAGMVKLYPLVLGPFLLRRFGWRAVWPGALLVAGVSAPYAAPYVLPHVKQSVDLYFELFEFNAGPYFAVKQAFSWATGADWSKQIGPAFRALFLAALPGLYVLDAWRNWSFRRAALVTLGLFFVLSTTVHPWYLLTILPLAVLAADAAAARSETSSQTSSGTSTTGLLTAPDRPSWAWLWLGALSIGTYLLYVDGPYWPWVIAGWGGAAGLAVLTCAGTLRRWLDCLLQRIQRRRGRAKADRILRVLGALEEGTGTNGASLRVLDLGAGEGYVGQAVRERTGADVALMDVVDMNRTSLPHQVYDGKHLPAADDAFDVTVLYFVLHHARQPERVLAEALRVSSRRVVVAESVVTGPWQHRLLRFLDRLANRVRSAGQMQGQEEHLTFRTETEWTDLARDLGAEVRAVDRTEHPVHPQVVYVLEPDASPEPVVADAESAPAS